MLPFRHPACTAVLGQPRNWDETEHGKCEGLPVAAAHGVTFSYWRPSFKERLDIALGGHIRLGVFGTGHPPVSIDTL
jgi:hypothetical protein